MTTKKFILLSLILLFISTGCVKNKQQLNKTEQPLVTFIELGSVKCIPCKKMQIVMKNIEEKYGSQLNTVFYDVWTEEGKPYAEKYKIDLIPTQIFMDKNGNEYFRHEGYFREEEVIKVLNKQGLN